MVVKNNKIMRLSVTGFLLLCSLNIACQDLSKNYIAISTHSKCIYGVLGAGSLKTAQHFLGEISKSSRRKIVISKSVTTDVPPINLLPIDNAISSWIKCVEPRTYVGNKLYNDVINAQPKLFHQHGFIRQAYVEYKSPSLASYPLIMVEIFDMGTTENAFGIYSSIRYPEDEIDVIHGTRVLLSEENIMFAKGKYFVQIEEYEFSTRIRQASITFARIIIESIKAPREPNILKLLPEMDRVPDSERIYISSVGFANKSPLFSEHVLGDKSAKSASVTLSKPSWFSGSPEVIMAFLIYYDDKLTVDSVYDRFQRYLELNEFDFRLIDDEMIIENTEHN